MFVYVFAFRLTGEVEFVPGREIFPHSEGNTVCFMIVLAVVGYSLVGIHTFYVKVSRQMKGHESV